MSRASRLVGLLPVGFVALTAVLAAATVAGGWTMKGKDSSAGYGVVADAGRPAE